ncbi:unnamed protein product [Adineta steineri]|uniref:F-box domain-containing protein n=1 Tax=Adineta steineri TaxID=433720 RepID=A0A819HTT2_9BILA|nr:unnamed protein product [Adineta steineri]
MNNNLLQLESLPNEIFAGIFEFLQCPELFQAFYHLNSRFNNLLQSLPYLTVNLLTNYTNNNNDFFPYVRSLIIDRAIDINLCRFMQIRSLTLRYPTDQLLAQLISSSSLHLEHLSVNHMHVSVLNYIPNLCDKVFSNGFSKLKSCHLLEWGTIVKNSQWTILPCLYILKIGKIDLFIYKSILSSCPNLYFLQLATVISSNTSIHIRPHLNLKRIVIRTTVFVERWTDDDMNICLSYVPNLEYLSVHQPSMIFPQKNDWLASIIACHLPCLHQFHYYFHIFDIERIMEPNIELLLNEFKRKFKIAHHKRYLSRFSIIRAQLI